MRFVDSKRFSPVVHMGDLPAEEDLFHFRSSDIDKSKDGRAEFIEKNNIIIDKEWWQKQYIRCTQGYYVENAIERGGDAIVDGVDAIWDSNDCYLPQYDLLIRNKTIFIPPRYYFYLNFWLIYGVPEGEHVKQLMKPLFTDMDFLCARRIEMMYLLDCDDQELKSRQKGYSEKMAGMGTGYNYTFLPASINVIVGGTQGDADHTMSNTIRGLDELANTQFYLARKKGGDRADYIESAKTKSKVLSLTAKDNAQTVSRYSPTLVIMEEVGKGKKEWSLETAEFIKPSIYAQNGIKTGWIIYIGTGGEMSEGVYDLEQRCYNPKDYNLLTFKNIWTELTTNYGEEVSHFTAAWWMKIMDKNGNTLKAESLEAIEREYKNTAADKKYRFKTQSPIFIENVFLSSDAGYFGKDAIMLLNNRYASIVGNKAFQIEKQYVLEFKNPKNPFAGVTFKPKENGWLNIIEEPFKDLEGETYLNLYTSGCLIPGEKVLTNNGFKNVELVNERDKLINENGKSVSITKFYIHKKINSSVYNIKVSNTLRSNIVTEEHPVLITKPKFYPDKTIKEIDFDFNYIEASKIEVGDWTRIPNMYTNTNYDISNFWDNGNSRIDRHIKNPLLEKDFWWFVGLWIGDGYCVNNKITISINSKEQCYINKLEQIVVNLFDRKLEIRKRNPSCYECSFSFAQLTEFLFLHFGKYSHSKFISEWVKYIDPIYKKNLLHGYLDSDGCIYRHTKGYYQLCYVSINLELLESFQDIAFSLGHISNLCQLREKGKVNFRGKDFDTKVCYQLRFGHHDTLAFVKSLDTLIDDHKIKKINFNDLPNIRKRPKEDCFISNDNKYIYFKIKEITTELYNGLVYNFECDTHTYLGRNIGYHNCDSYDQDEAHTSTSKGAMYIKKGYLPGHAITNNWVAEIIERPTVADGGARTFYLHTAMACIAYSCQNNIEYSNLRIFDFYENNGFTSLLKLRPILAFAGKIQNTKVSNRYGTDKSLKPHILAILRDILSPDVINNMYFTRQIRALSKFIYDPSGKKYNCDITIATAECEVSYKENQGFAAKSRGEKKEEVRKRYERDSNGYIKITYK